MEPWSRSKGEIWAAVLVMDVAHQQGATENGADEQRLVLNMEVVPIHCYTAKVVRSPSFLLVLTVEISNPRCECSLVRQSFGASTIEAVWGDTKDTCHTKVGLY